MHSYSEYDERKLIDKVNLFSCFFSKRRLKDKVFHDFFSWLFVFLLAKNRMALKVTGQRKWYLLIGLVLNLLFHVLFLSCLYRLTVYNELPDCVLYILQNADMLCICDFFKFMAKRYVCPMFAFNWTLFENFMKCFRKCENTLGYYKI